MNTTRLVERCQVCSSPDLESVFFLGFLPPVNQMHPVGQRPAEQPAYPAEWLHCRQCSLVQLGLVVDGSVLFPPDYPYTSGTTRILRENFSELCRESRPLLGLQKEDLVIDIGSNDGTLLSNFRDAGHRVHGIEPTQMGVLATSRGIPTTIAFFGKEAASAVRKAQGQAKLVTATNVFAHMEDVHGALEGILDLLDPDGTFVSESHYLASLLETLQYDTIYHEHLRYYSLKSLEHLLGMHGLEVFHAKRIPTHGGSIRVYAARKGVRPVQPSVSETRQQEEGKVGPEALRTFRARAALSKMELHALLGGLKRQGKRIYGVGAPSRASTLIQYAGIDDGILDCVLEVAGSHKIGKCMPGTVIPVVEESRLFTAPPDALLMLSWHIADEIAANLARKGFRGEIIVPLPLPRVFHADAGHRHPGL